MLTIEDENHHLEPLQARLLHFFINKKGQVLNTSEIAAEVWERKQVSDNLVRQVISNLRKQLNDNIRPYKIIQTISKQGYLLNLDICYLQPESAFQTEPVHNQPAIHQNKSSFSVKVIICMIVVLITGLTAWDLRLEQSAIFSSKDSQNQVIPIVFYDTALDSEQDYAVASSVFEYLFFGLSSSKHIVGYRHSQLTLPAREQLSKEAIEIKSWVKKTDTGYVLKLTIIDHSKSNSTRIFKQSFTKNDFFNSIGDLILEMKTQLIPFSDDYGVASHRITSIDKFEDWQIIARAISLFYQGKGSSQLMNVEKELVALRKQGRDYYLLDSLGSYIASMHYLNDHGLKDRLSALTQASRAFEKNPRCTIANTTLGLALLLNDKSEQAYPYLFYASENAPSPLSYYLLSIANQQSNNPRGAEHYYQLFSSLNKSNTSELFDLNLYLQNPNNEFLQSSEH